MITEEPKPNRIPKAPPKNPMLTAISRKICRTSLPPDPEAGYDKQCYAHNIGNQCPDKAAGLKFGIGGLYVNRIKLEPLPVLLRYSGRHIQVLQLYLYVGDVIGRSV